jgi:pimeloyl-ACP methyl ester carboxylesterase
MAEQTRRLIPGPQGRLRIDDGGQGGLPILFLHGGAARLDQWAPALERQRRRRRAAALDLRGHGGSEPPRDGDYALEAMTEDVLAAADALGLDRFVLVAHSYGTAVAAAVAAAWPERLAGLVLVDGGVWIPVPADLELLRHGFRPSTYAAFVEGWFEPLLANARPTTRAEVLASLRATPRQVFAAAMYGSMGFDPRPAVAAFPGPKLAIAAAALDGPMMLQQAVPGLPSTLLEGVSHWVMLDAPDAFDERLEAFLAQVG